MSKPEDTSVIEPAPALLNCRQAARRLGLHPRTVWRMAKDGELPALRLSPHGHWRFPAANIDRIVAEIPRNEHGTRIHRREAE